MEQRIKREIKRGRLYVATVALIAISLVISGLFIALKVEAASSDEWYNITDEQFRILIGRPNMNSTDIAIAQAKLADYWGNTSYKIWLVKYHKADNTVLTGSIYITQSSVDVWEKVFQHGMWTYKPTNSTSFADIAHNESTPTFIHTWIYAHEAYAEAVTETIEILHNPFAPEPEEPLVPIVRYYYPADVPIDVSVEQLNSALYEQLMILEFENVAMVRIALDRSGTEIIDWDRDEVYYHEVENPSVPYYADLTQMLKNRKGSLGIGTHRFYGIAFTQEGFENPEITEPELEFYFDVIVVEKTEDIENGGGANNGGLPTAPSPPEDNWDVVGWLKYIFDWLMYLFSIIGYMLKRIGDLITTGFGQITGLTETLRAYFSWLPSEIVTVMMLGILTSVIVALVKR